MGIIKLVTNGDKTATFKAISLGHATTMFFGMASIIGALSTWNMAITWDRSMLVNMIRDEMALTVKADNTATALALSQLNGRLLAVEDQMREQERQIILNTARLDQVAAAWKQR